MCLPSVNDFIILKAVRSKYYDEATLKLANFQCKIWSALSGDISRPRMISTINNFTKRNTNNDLATNEDSVSEIRNMFSYFNVEKNQTGIAFLGLSSGYLSRRGKFTFTNKENVKQFNLYFTFACIRKLDYI